MFRTILCAILFCLLPLRGADVLAATFHVAVDGDDATGNGSQAAPWATIGHALAMVADGSVIEVHPGTYNGRIRLQGNFATGVVVRSQVPYRARLRNSDRVITSYTDREISGITIEGFDIAHSGPGAGALVVHIDGGGDNRVHDIALVDNVLHDSYNNDILKINNGCTDIVVRGNIFYNQSGSDEHIDINSVRRVTVEDNIFFNDLAGSGRTNHNDTSSYIVIKDSNGDNDIFTGSSRITVRRNIFANWQGSTGTCFLLIGEDGQPFHEAFDVLVENNLMLGNSANVMRAAFGVKGGRDITFRNNTISGDLPSLAFAMRLNTEGANPVNTDIRFFNNAWVDQTGTMGAENPSRPNDFSDTPPADNGTVLLHNNLYWNGGRPIPEDTTEQVNISDDSARIVADPLLPAPVHVVLPRWNASTGLFADGSATIRAAFVRLAGYARPAAGSPLIGHADAAHAAADDILGHARQGAKDIGALESDQAPAPVPTPGPVGGTAITPVYLLLF